MRRRLRRLGHAARALSLLLALLAGATAAIWQLRPQWVEALQDRARARHLEGPAVAVAVARHATDPAGVLAALAPVAAQLRDVDKGEALDPLRRAALRLRLDAHLKLGDRAAALATCEEWTQWDPADLDATLARNALRRADTATAATARDELLALSRGLPAAVAVLREVVLAEGLDPAARFDAVARALRLVSLVPTEDLVTLPWAFAAGGDAGADTALRPVIAERAPDAMIFRLQLPAGTAVLELQLPPHTPLVLFRPGLVMPALGAAIDLTRQPVVLQQCARLAADRFASDGGAAPTLRWTLPEPLAVATEAQLLFEVAAPPPPWLAALLQDSRANELDALLRDDADLPARRRLAHLRACCLSGLEVRGVDDDAAAAPLQLLRPPEASAVRLQARLPRPTRPGAALRVPSMHGIRWELAALRLAADGEAMPSIPVDASGARLDAATGTLLLPALPRDAARQSVEVELRATAEVPR
ncbi:MAG: hypothetical protein AB7O97_23285 [Planctomycetota bacterium]